MRSVAERALRTQQAGNQVVLIVSAMAGETNRLLDLAHKIAPVPDMREMDSLASTGEQVSAALMAMTIHALGGQARSFLGHQIRIHTDDAFTKARILTIEGSKLLSSVNEGRIAVVAGFQGVDSNGSAHSLGGCQGRGCWHRPICVSQTVPEGHSSSLLQAQRVTGTQGPKQLATPSTTTVREWV